MPKKLLQKYDHQSYTSFPNKKRSLIGKMWKIFWQLLKGERSDIDDYESGTALDDDDNRDVDFNHTLTGRLQLMSDRLDDLAQAQQNLLAVIQKLQNVNQEEEMEQCLL